MRARRGALIVLSTLALSAAVATVAFAGNPAPPPGFQAAVAACAARGLQQGTDAFAQCVNQQLGGSVPPAGAGGQKPPTQTGPAPTATTPAQKASQQCLAQGLKQGTSALSACVQRLLMSPKQQDAYDTCVAQGKTQANGLADCVNALLQAGSSPQLTPRQQDDVDYCLGAGKVQGTSDFIACIKTAGNRNLTTVQQAAVDQCQKQGGSDAAVASCVGALLTTKVPPKPGTAGPSPAAVQAAFNACIKQKLKPGTAAFQSCVNAKLKSP
jgi:hypothetical protein